MKLRKSQGRKTKNMQVQIKKGRRMGKNIKIRREKSKSIFFKFFFPKTENFTKN